MNSKYINVEIEGHSDIVSKVYEVIVQALISSKQAHRRINIIKDNPKWLWRTLAGAIILAAATFIIGGGLKKEGMMKNELEKRSWNYWC